LTAGANKLSRVRSSRHSTAGFQPAAGHLPKGRRAIRAALPLRFIRPRFDEKNMRVSSYALVGLHYTGKSTASSVQTNRRKRAERG
jgi:hypothetical protein